MSTIACGRILISYFIGMASSGCLAAEPERASEFGLPSGLPVFPAINYGRFSPDKTDHSPIIRLAIDAASKTGGGIVRLPPGSFWVAADMSGAAISLPANVYLDMRGTILKLIENDREHYQIILFESPGPSGVVGGTVVGDRATHTGNKGEWGMCISVRGGANVKIKSVKTLDCWGDGVYVGAHRETHLPASNLQIEDVESAFNRRNNISVVSVNGFSISGVYLHNAKGTPPESGIDIEPDPGDHVENGSIEAVRTEQNGRRGFMIDGGQAVVRNVKLSDISSSGNGGAGIYLQRVQQLTARSLRSSYNGREGLVLIDSQNVRIDSYAGLLNSAMEPFSYSDTSIHGSRDVLFNTVMIDRHPRAATNSYTVDVHRTSKLSVNNFRVQGDMSSVPIRIDSYSDALIGDQRFLLPRQK